MHCVKSFCTSPRGAVRVGYSGSRRCPEASGSGRRRFAGLLNASPVAVLAAGGPTGTAVRRHLLTSPA